jgi:NAD(P)-dependent dehydrogenase (short-subunit alcohol dehydrogenase family)
VALELRRRFEGKVVLVTGAASGIGRATVRVLAREGASVFCVDVRATAAEAVALTSAGERVERVGK